MKIEYRHKGIKILSNFETIEWNKTCEECGSRFIDKMMSFGGRFPMRVRDFKSSQGTCQDCEAKKNLIRDEKMASRFLFWTEDTVKEHFTNTPPNKGDKVIVVDTSGGLLDKVSYEVAQIVDPAHTKQRRIATDATGNGYSGASFYRSGKNCFAPKGQVRLIPYCVTIEEAIEATKSLLRQGEKKALIDEDTILEIARSLRN